MARILVVDDSAFMRMVVRELLEDAGHEVVGEGINGEEGIRKYKKLRPDFVTMDITMPEMNGISATEEILRFDPSAKVIMCSAMGQQSMILDAIKAGAKDFLIKPFQKYEVVDAVEKMSRKR